MLLWVLSGSSKVALRPVTWWFPIVGSIPYKGFFDKEDADAAAKQLDDRDFDTYLRPSAAFSTLGWFNDPLLSTTLRYDETSLANTVIHEILHNTIWVKNHVPFNETLANFVGNMGAIQFFTNREGADSERVKDAKLRWSNELDFARFLVDTAAKLDTVYRRAEKVVERRSTPEEEELYKQLVAERDGILKEALDQWLASHQVPKGKSAQSKLNNAVIIAHQIYLTKPWVFADLFHQVNDDLTAFIREMKVVAEMTAKDKLDPYDAVVRHTEELRAHQSAPLQTAPVS